jgi:hypothetical protein
LAVPGAKGIGQTEDLVAIWKTKGSQRFQNYRSIFTVLDVPQIPRDWIEKVQQGQPCSPNAPGQWLKWVEKGEYHPLQAPRTIGYRTRQEQLPTDPLGRSLLECVVSYYKNHPAREYAFERCAAAIVQLMDPMFTEIDLTRPWRDGGRDAVGIYRIGTAANSIHVEFALEAKCKNPDINNSSGVKETSRLISRLRHRQFGIFITTSCLHEQAYQEIVEDGHPVLVVSGRDIVEILVRSGMGDVGTVQKWLQSMT